MIRKYFSFLVVGFTLAGAVLADRYCGTMTGAVILCADYDWTIRELKGIRVIPANANESDESGFAAKIAVIKSDVKDGWPGYISGPVLRSDYSYREFFVRLSPKSVAAASPVYIVVHLWSRYSPAVYGQNFDWVLHTAYPGLVLNIKRHVP